MVGVGAAGARPEAVLVVVSDVHSAYDKYAQLVARVDRVRAENPAIPLAILVDGDVFEAGNALARRTDGVLDFALMSGLARRASTILTLGNHEPDLMKMAAVVARLRAAGVVVISGTAADRQTGRLFAPASTTLALGTHRLTIVGLTTNSLPTFRAAVRPELTLADPAAWGAEHLPELLAGVELPVVLSHAGLRGDKPLLDKVPNGTLFIGAHDHLQFVHQPDRTVYFQSGSWLQCVSIVFLERSGAGLRWRVQQQPLAASDAADPELAALVEQTFEQNLSPAEREVVGHITTALSPQDAARFAVEAARRATGANVAVIGGTTFGGGLPAGNVTRYAFDGCVRFDGTLYVGDVDGLALRTILGRANQGAATPFTDRSGENLIATGVAPADIKPGRRYRLVTTDWIARNPQQYLGAGAPVLSELPEARLKDVILRALRASAAP